MLHQRLNIYDFNARLLKKAKISSNIEIKAMAHKAYIYIYTRNIYPNVPRSFPTALQ